METPKTLGIGLHKNIDAATYHSLGYCSNSRLTALAHGCPKKVRWAIDHPEPPTPALIIGEAVHVATLQPEIFPSMFVRAGICEATKKDGKRCTNPGKAIVESLWMCGVHLHGDAATDPRRILTPDEFDQVEQMRDAIFADRHAAEILAECAEREVTAIWKLANGLTCKARLDLFSIGGELIADLKTTEDASPAFERKIDDYGYARQAAMYKWWAQTRGYRVGAYRIIAVEKSAPFCVGIHTISERAIDLAADELSPLLDLYRKCEVANDWPGYEPRVSGLPVWAEKRIEAAVAAEVSAQ